MKKLNSTYEFTDRPDLRSPYSIEAERSVLGSVLIEPECIDLLSRVLADRDFYIKEHRRIFRAMLELFYAGITIDTVTLTDALLTPPTRGGGRAYIYQGGNKKLSHYHSRYSARLK